MLENEGEQFDGEELAVLDLAAAERTNNGVQAIQGTSQPLESRIGALLDKSGIVLHEWRQNRAATRGTSVVVGKYIGDAALAVCTAATARKFDKLACVVGTDRTDLDSRLAILVDVDGLEGCGEGIFD